jgi:elongation factor G
MLRFRKVARTIFCPIVKESRITALRSTNAGRKWLFNGHLCRFYSEAAPTVEEVVSEIGQVRNIGIVAHVDAGKTTLTEKILYYSGVSRRVGNVDRGDTVMDYLLEERQRGITIKAAATSVLWHPHRDTDQKAPFLINIIDTPGHVDFTFEVERSLSVMDGAIVLIDAVAGVQAQTSTVWRQAERYNLPRIIFLNKCDRSDADIPRCMRQIQRVLGCKPALITAPVEWDEKIGIGDLLLGDRMLFFEGSYGENVRTALMSPETSIRSKFSARQSFCSPWSQFVQNQRDALIEMLADANDHVCSKYLEGVTITPQELRQAIRSATIRHQIVPVLCGSALHSMGVQPLLDAVVDFLPSPAERPPRQGETIEGTRVEVTTSARDPVLAYVFKIQQDTHRGPLAFVRVFSSGSNDPLRPGSVVKVLSSDRLNWQKATQERVNTVLRVHADHFMPLQRTQPGGIYALSGLKQARTGDTLIAAAAAEPQSVLRLPPIPIPEPMFSVALERDSGYQRSAQEALLAALQLLVRDDPSLRYSEDERTGELLLSGMGELHLDIAYKRLKREFNLDDLRMSAPRVALYETILGSSQHLEKSRVSIQCAGNRGERIPVYSLDRMIGATRLTASMCVSVHPLEQKDSSDGIKLENEVQFCPALHCQSNASGETITLADAKMPPWMRIVLTEGAQAALRRGPRSGFPVIGTRAVIHHVLTESASEAALRACVAEAVHNALSQTGTKLVEPLMHVRIRLSSVGGQAAESSPEENSVGNEDIQNLYGLVVRDLVSPQRRGQVLGTDDSNTIVEALVPLEGLIGYATALRSLTGGQASFEAFFSKYEPIDEMFANRLLERR